eukprot:scaffold288766_cov33-Tisochrysis_lutea.AAC.3
MVESENKGSLMALVDNTPERVRVSSHPENECKAELAQLSTLAASARVCGSHHRILLHYFALTHSLADRRVAGLSVIASLVGMEVVNCQATEGGWSPDRCDSLLDLR